MGGGMLVWLRRQGLLNCGRLSSQTERNDIVGEYGTNEKNSDPKEE
jgi:hypothetical protein